MIITEEHLRKLESEAADIRLYIESQVEERVKSLEATLDEVREHLTGLVVDLQDRVGGLESELRRVGELAQNAEYLASDAKSAAEQASTTAQRGW